jgi:RHS repeat-associated protein
MSVANGSGPCWTDTSVASGGASASGGIITPASGQTLFYDAEGNLTYDGLWTYEWDAENRLTGMSMTNSTSLPNAKRLRLDFAYDYIGRRISKTVKSWDGTEFGSPKTIKFVHDLPAQLSPASTLLATLDSDDGAIQSFAWGQDVTGSVGQPGAVGALILLTTGGTSATNCFVAYDGSGSVTALVDANTQAIDARYEYNPFGVTLRMTGTIAAVNPFRFSTKFTDDENGLVFYGYRYYSPRLGRWFGKDRLEEANLLNLYMFVANNPILYIDTDGARAGSLAQVKNMKSWLTIIKMGTDLYNVFKSPMANVAMASGPVGRLATGGAWAILYAAVAVCDAFSDIITGTPRQEGTIQANAIDFVINTVNGNKAEADLDAVTIAVQVVTPSPGMALLSRGFAESDAVMAWGALTWLEDSVMQ